MYVAFVTIVVGQAAWLANAALFLSAAVLWLLFHLRVVTDEEPTLARQFQESFDRRADPVPEERIGGPVAHAVERADEADQPLGGVRRERPSEE